MLQNVASLARDKSLRVPRAGTGAASTVQIREVAVDL